MEPLYEGEPILAVAAVDELTAAEAIEKIRITYERLPFVIDPLESLLPGGPNARTDGNVWMRPAAPPPNPADKAAAKDDKGGRGGRGGAALPQMEVVPLKWTEEDFKEYSEGRLPMGKPTDQWSYGDVEAGFKKAALVLDETFQTPNTSHQCLETRTAMCYWQNGKVFVHTGTQSTAQTVPGIARWLSIPPENVVLISEYTGGAFGSKITAAISLVIPALLSKKVNAPVRRVGSRRCCISRKPCGGAGWRC
jgi:xanthine dehydrogenase molybdenum-binding subunit